MDQRDRNLRAVLGLGVHLPLLHVGEGVGCLGGLQGLELSRHQVQAVQARRPQAVVDVQEQLGVLAVAALEADARRAGDLHVGLLLALQVVDRELMAQVLEPPHQQPGAGDGGAVDHAVRRLGHDRLPAAGTRIALEDADDAPARRVAIGRQQNAPQYCCGTARTRRARSAPSCSAASRRRGGRPSSRASRRCPMQPTPSAGWSRRTGAGSS